MMPLSQLRDMEGGMLFQGTAEDCAEFLRWYFLGKLRELVRL